MAGDIPPILIDVQIEMGRVKAQLDTLQNEIKQVGNAAKAQEAKVGGLEGKLGKMAKSFKGLLGAAAVTAVLTESAKAAVEDAESMALLNKQLELSVGANKDQMAAVDASIQKMADVSGIVDDDIRPAFSALVRGTKDVATAQSLTTLALDASVAKGKDVTAVANALAKAQNGQTRQLAMLFPELKNSKDMMGDLAKETKGAAEAAADANPLKRLNESFDEVKETLGKALIPLLSAFNRILKPLMPIIELVAEVVAYLVEALMPLVETILDAVMPAFQAIMKVIKPILEKLLPPLIKLLDKILVPVLIFLSDIIVMYLVPYLEKLGDVAGGFLTQAVDFLVTAFEQLVAILGPFWETVLKPLVDGLMNMMGIKVEPVVKPKVDESELKGLDYSGLAGLGKVTGSGVKTARSGPSAAAKAAADQAKAILKAQTDFQKASKKAQQDYQKDITDRTNDFKKSFADATKTDIGAIWNEGYQSADALVQALKDKLASTKTFAENIGKLSAAGYTEDFMKQVQSMGPMMGNQLAQELLSGSPLVADELKTLFAESNLISNTGVDAVAKNLIPTFTDATTRLGNAMVDAANQLATALAKIKNITPEAVTGATKGAIKGATGGGQKTPPIINVNTNVNNSGASAQDISGSVVSAIKFNVPYIIQDLSNSLMSNAVSNLEAEWSNPFGGRF